MTADTTVHEIAEGVFRLSTLVPEAAPGGLTFNQFLITGDEPFLFHTGPRGLFPLVSVAIAKVVPALQLRWISLGHVEADVSIHSTPHVPHGWEAQVLFDATTATQFCGDLLSRVGNWPAIVHDDIVGPALDADEMFGATCLTPATAPTVRRLADAYETRLEAASSGAAA